MAVIIGWLLEALHIIATDARAVPIRPKTRMELPFWMVCYDDNAANYGNHQHDRRNLSQGPQAPVHLDRCSAILGARAADTGEPIGETWAMIRDRFSISHCPLMARVDSGYPSASGGSRPYQVIGE